MSFDKQLNDYCCKAKSVPIRHKSYNTKGIVNVDVIDFNTVSCGK